MAQSCKIDNNENISVLQNTHFVFAHFLILRISFWVYIISWSPVGDGGDIGEAILIFVMLLDLTLFAFAASSRSRSLAGDEYREGEVGLLVNTKDPSKQLLREADDILRRPSDLQRVRNSNSSNNSKSSNSMLRVVFLLTYPFSVTNTPDERHGSAI